MNNKEEKLTIVLGVIVGILVLTIGVSYSLFTFNRVSKNASLVVGDIYMHYNETNQITIENAMPSDTYTNDYFEFKIDGKNTTTNKDIWYEIVLNHGDNHETRTERIKDNLLMFRLTEVNDNIETEIFTNKSFNNLENKRIYVNTINKNTTNEIKHTYRLYMWVSNKTKIGNTEDVDYDPTTWNNQVYGSIKVNVSGDFLEKYITPESSCFECEDNETGVSITNYNATCGSKIVIPDTINNKKVTRIKSNAFKDKKLEFVSIPSTVITIDSNAFTNNKIENITIPDTVSDLNCKAFDSTVSSNRDMTCAATPTSCFTYQEIDGEIEITDYDATCGTDVVIPDTINNLDVISITGTEERIGDIAVPTGGFSRKGITSVILPKKLTKIGKNAFNTNELESIEIPDSVISIGQYAFYANKIKNIIIPDGTISIGMSAFMSNEVETLILGNSLTTIGDGAFERNKLTSLVFSNSITSIGDSAFIENLLTNVEIPNSVNSIGNSAFSNNKLTNIVIPDSVNSIGNSAFYNNQLTSITIGSGIQYIGYAAFSKEDTSNPNLVKITINKTCSDIKNITQSNISTIKYYPWLTEISPYTATGVTIYGSNNEVCDSF